MGRKYFFKSQSVSQRKFAAGILVATFYAGAFGNYASAMKPELNVEHSKNGFDEKDYIVKSGDIATLTDEEGVVWGYDENEDGEILEKINNTAKLYNGVPGLIEKYGNPEKFDKWITESGILQYGKIKEKFCDRFKKQMGIKDIIFAFIKCGYSFDCSLDMIENSLFKPDVVYNALKYVFFGGSIVDENEEVKEAEEEVKEDKKIRRIGTKTIIVIFIAVALIVLLIILLPTTSFSKKTTDNKETAGPESSKKEPEDTQKSSDDDKKKASEELDSEAVTGMSSTTKKVGKVVAVSLLGISGGLGTKFVGEKISNSNKSRKVETNGNNGEEKSKLLVNKDFVDDEVAETESSSVVRDSLDGFSGVAKDGAGDDGVTIIKG